jgi:hypothetical protein
MATIDFNVLPYINDFSILKGNPIEWAITVDVDGVATDFTDCTLTYKVETQDNPAVVKIDWTAITPDDADAGIFTFRLTAGQTTSWLGKYRYYIKCVWPVGHADFPLGATATIISGEINVSSLTGAGVVYADNVQRMITAVRDFIGDRDNRENVIKIRCTRYNATAATLDIANGSLATSVSGGTGSALNLILANESTLYDVVEKMEDNGDYEVTFVGTDGSHDPRDLLPVHSKSILGTRYILKTQHWFSDYQIYQWIYDCCLRILQDYVPETLRQDDEEFVSIHAALHGSTLLLAGAAKYFGASFEGFTADRSALVRNYVELSRSLRERLQDIGHTITQGRIVHESNVTGRLSPSADVYIVLPVIVSLDTSTVTTATIKWTQTLEHDLYGYEVYRKTGSGAYTLVTTIYDRHTLDYEDTGLVSGTTYTYKVRLKTSLLVSRQNAYPAQPAASTYKYIDSNELEVTLP